MPSPKASEREAARLAEIACLGAARSETDRVLQELVDDLRGAFGVDLCMVSLVLSDVQYFRAWSGNLPEELARPRQGPREESICRHVVETEAPLVVQDFLATERFRDQHFRTRYGIRFYAGAPLTTSGGHAVGSLCLLDTGPRRFGDDDLRLLSAFARAAVGRLEVLAALGREREARESEREYRQNVFGLAGDAILILDPETGTILEANDRAYETYRLPKEKLVGANAADLSLNPDRGKRHVRAVLAEGSYEGFESVHRRGDGRPMNVSINSSVIEWRGRRAILSINRDVTERVEAEEKLRASEAELRALFAAMTDVVMVFDEEGRYLRIASTDPSLLYAPTGDRLGKTVRDVLPEEEAGVFLARIRRALAEHRTIHAEYSLDVRGGRRWFSAAVSPMQEDKVVWVARDTTERKSAEEALQRSEARLRAAQRTAHVGNWEQVIGGDLYWSDELYRIYGLAPQQFAPTRKDFVERVHPEDREFVEKTHDEVVRHGAGPDVECRIVRPDGEVRIVQNRFEVTRDGQGRLVKIAGTVQDITERKRSEESLKESEERFRTLTDAALEGIVVMEDAEILEINQACKTMFGYEPEEIIGQPVLMTVAPESRELVSRSIAAGSENTYEATGLRKDGTRFDMEVRGRSSEYRGRSVRITAIRDITDRKEAEAALRESEERFRSLVQNNSDIIAVLGADGRERYLSPSFGRVLGHEPEDPGGRTVFDLLHPADVGRARTSLTELLENPRAISPILELRMRHKDGSWRHLEGIATNLLYDPTVNGIVVNARDVTDRKAAEEELRAAEARHRALVEQVPAVVYTGELNRPGATTYVSPQIEALLGYAPDEFVEDPDLWAGIVHPEDRGRVLAEGRRTKRTGEPFSYEYRMVRRDGGVVWVQDEAVLVRDGEGRPLFWQGVKLDVTDRKALERRLRHYATHDALTGLPNRTLFVRHLERARTRADKGSFAVLFLDLDNFKVINDSLGHEAGDRLLVAAARRLRSCLRPGDTVARLGGDEFTILLEDLGTPEEAFEVAERVAEALRAPLELAGRVVYITASIGVALDGSSENGSAELLKNADTAMYRAKTTGKAHYEVFEAGMNVRLLERLKMEHDLRRALERREFVVYYQPLIRASTGDVAGMEALLRWRHPERGFLLPREFVPLAEETGLILPLDRWVLGEACRQAHLWQEDRGTPLSISVNLSAHHFSRPGLVEKITDTLKEFGPREDGLVLEITESVAMGDAPHVGAALRTLRSAGVRLAVDDFGTGYSALRHLRGLPIDVLKIDKSFVEGVGKIPEDAALVSAMIGVAHALGLEAVAEGVETREQLDRLREMGCDLLQGNHFSKPLTARAASELLADHRHR